MTIGPRIDWESLIVPEEDNLKIQFTTFGGE